MVRPNRGHIIGRRATSGKTRIPVPIRCMCIYIYLYTETETERARGRRTTLRGRFLITAEKMHRLRLLNNRNKAKITKLKLGCRFEDRRERGGRSDDIRRLPARLPFILFPKECLLKDRLRYRTIEDELPQYGCCAVVKLVR